MMKLISEKLLRRVWFAMMTLLALSTLMPGISAADSMSGVGDLTITTLDTSAQKTLELSGAVGANQTDLAAIDPCATKAKDALTAGQQHMARAMTYSDPVKKLNDSVNACFDNIQTISALVTFPTFNFTQMFETLLKQLIERLVNEVIMKICAAATGAWNSAVGNAIDTLNNGINQSGINTFGNVVTVGPAPVNPAPMAPAPLNTPSAIPGL
ncbi:hypothetical protein [Undibacterium sp. TC9W]|uniref:hypothetical protein n=1 Tax=Undibacterium sp. TC9W TaxID=3413053 RepID=UPI003BEF595F